MAAVSIITVLSNIPWGQVVETAPKVADGAAKLWNAVKNRRKPDHNAKAEVYTEQSEADILKARLAALEENVLSLQDQMRASTELIKALAEQNAKLVQRIELNSARLFWFATVSALGVVGLLGAIVYLVFQR